MKNMVSKLNLKSLVIVLQSFIKNVQWNSVSFICNVHVHINVEGKRTIYRE
jgi:hypothetical protein